MTLSFLINITFAPNDAPAVVAITLTHFVTRRKVALLCYRAVKRPRATAHDAIRRISLQRLELAALWFRMSQAMPTRLPGVLSTSRAGRRLREWNLLTRRPGLRVRCVALRTGNAWSELESLRLESKRHLGHGPVFVHNNLLRGHVGCLNNSRSKTLLIS